MVGKKGYIRILQVLESERETESDFERRHEEISVVQQKNA